MLDELRNFKKIADRELQIVFQKNIFNGLLDNRVNFPKMELTPMAHFLEFALLILQGQCK